MTITTTGDRREIPRDPRDIGKALWTREIEEALRDGEIDLAVHSLKDLPAKLPEGLEIGAVRPREDPRDVLVSAGDPVPVDGLARGARVGTGSTRRVAALLRSRPDLEVVPLKGNVPTRLKRLEEGAFDAIVLAAAGLNRLGLKPPGGVPLEPDVMTPALCQGIVAIEVREADLGAPWVAALDHEETATATRAERALLGALGVGCGAPVGGLARLGEGTVEVFGEVLSLDGASHAAERASGPTEEAAALGRAVGRRLVEDSAAELLAELLGPAAAHDR